MIWFVASINTARVGRGVQPRALRKDAGYYEQHATALAAIQREKNIKHWSRARKIELIRSLNPDWRDLWDDIVR
jgi:predicted GIY-YIG superfamily endonuclease